MSINLQQQQPLDYLPISIDCRERLVMVVGGEKLAARKVGLLLRVGAKVVVVAPSLCHQLSQQASDGIITHIQSDFASDLLNQAPLLVIAASKQDAQNQRVAQAARAKNIPINVVDKPALCTFIFPAIVDRAPMSIAISTAGNSPLLSRLVREYLEAVLPTTLGEVARFAGHMRAVIKSRLQNATARLRFWEHVLRGPIAQSILQGNHNTLKSQFNTAINKFSTMAIEGDIAWITVVSDDRELLTLKALRLLQQADVICYDDTVNQAMLELARRDADTIDFGNTNQGENQVTMEKSMLALARSGKRVCCLSKLDPCLCNANGDEMDPLPGARVNVQVLAGGSDARQQPLHLGTRSYHLKSTATTRTQH